MYQNSNLSGPKNSDSLLDNKSSLGNNINININLQNKNSQEAYKNIDINKSTKEEKVVSVKLLCLL